MGTNEIAFAVAAVDEVACVAPAGVGEGVGAPVGFGGDVGLHEGVQVLDVDV